MKHIHVICNTHWDREWRFSFQQSRIMLVRMMDRLLELMQAQPENRCFHLDGHTALVEDYLAIRPEKAAAVADLVEGGRLLIGPWYTLPDETMTCGEGLIRNLLWGRRTGETFGGRMAVGYTPTGFGQISQMPQIFNGCGIDSIIFYRGINRAQAPESDYIWEGPDGSRLDAFRLARFSRYNFYFLVYRPVIKNRFFADGGSFRWDEGGFPFHPADPERSHQEWWLAAPRDALAWENLDRGMDELLDELSESTTDELLGMAGDDQCGPSEHMVELVRRAAEWRDDVDVRISSLPEYIAAFRARQPRRRVVRGEMRHTSRDGLMTDLYAPILSARTYLNVEAMKREVDFFCWAEPMNAFAWLLGRAYPQALLDQALRLLLHNQAHDSIGGCALDKIHRDVMHRFSEIAEIADVLGREAAAHLASRIRTGGTHRDAFLVVFNPLPYARTEVVSTVLEFPREWGVRQVRAMDDEGNELDVQASPREPGDLMVQQPADIPVPFLSDRFQAHIAVPEVPPLGYRLLILGPETTRRWPRGTQCEEPLTMANEFMAVRVAADGTFAIEDRCGGRVFEGLHVFEDSGAVGDPWNRKTPAEDQVLYSRGTPARTSLVEDGELLTRLRIEQELCVPVEATTERRSSRTDRVPVVSTLCLRRGCPRLDITTTVDNTVGDHRLRVLFPTGIAADSSVAGAQFDVISRPVERPDTSTWVEPMSPTHPHRHFVDVCDGDGGLTLITEGLLEYEVLPDAARTLALTLFRAFQQRNTVRGVEYPWEKESQCPGEQTFRYALYPHATAPETARLWPTALAHHVAMRAFQCGSTVDGDMSPVGSYLTLEPEDLVLSGIKRGEDGKRLVVRFSNPTARPIAASVQCILPVRGAELLSLDEREVIGQAEINADGRVSTQVDAKRIVTLALDISHDGS